jgi:hypothetical protein
MFKKWLWAVLAVVSLLFATNQKATEDRAEFENFRAEFSTNLRDRLELLKDEWKEEYTAQVGEGLELKLIERFSEELGEKRALKLGEEFGEDIKEELHFALLGKRPSAEDFAKEFADAIGKFEKTEIPCDETETARHNPCPGSGNLGLSGILFLSAILMILAKVYLDYNEKASQKAGT